jgi:hypothetical protein
MLKMSFSRLPVEELLRRRPDHGVVGLQRKAPRLPVACNGTGELFAALMLGSVHQKEIRVLAELWAGRGLRQLPSAPQNY